MKLKKIKEFFLKNYIYFLFLISAIYTLDYLRNDFKFKSFWIIFLSVLSILIIYFIEEEITTNKKNKAKLIRIQYLIGATSGILLSFLKFGFSHITLISGLAIGFIIVISMPFLKYIIRQL